MPSYVRAGIRKCARIRALSLGVSRAVNGICLRVLTTRGNDAFDLIKDVSDFVVA